MRYKHDLHMDVNNGNPYVYYVTDKNARISFPCKLIENLMTK